jgi:hypothetical protein
VYERGLRERGSGGGREGGGDVVILLIGWVSEWQTEGVSECASE